MATHVVDITRRFHTGIYKIVSILRVHDRRVRFSMTGLWSSHLPACPVSGRLPLLRKGVHVLQQDVRPNPLLEVAATLCAIKHS